MRLRVEEGLVMLLKPMLGLRFRLVVKPGRGLGGRAVALMWGLG